MKIYEEHNDDHDYKLVGYDSLVWTAEDQIDDYKERILEAKREKRLNKLRLINEE